MTKKGSGKLWAIILLAIIIVLPLGSLYFLKKGFQFRENAPASEQLLKSNLQQIPNYFSVSQRGDTITKKRMLGKVCILDFVAYNCRESNDHTCHRLFDIQEDYYEKTKIFRIISPTISPQTDKTEKLEWMAERYSAREVWHFVNTGDTSRPALYDWCVKYFNKETDPDCPRFVYLVDGDGNIRGCYNPTDENQFHDLYNDVLYLINIMDIHEQEK